MPGFDWTDFGEGHMEQCLSWKMTGNNRMTSVVAQYKARLIKWRNLWASIMPFKTLSPLQDPNCEFKKDIFHATTEEIGAELESNQNQHHPVICSNRCYFPFSLFKGLGLETQMKATSFVLCLGSVSFKLI